MEKINYLEIFKKSWTITWHHKYLWWLGLFAGSGMSTGFNFPTDFKEKTGTSDWTEKIAPFIENHLALILGIIAFIFILFVILGLLKILAFNGLIRSVFGIKRGEIKNISEALNEGKKFFARILGIKILFVFSTLALILILTLPVIFLFSIQSYILGSLTTLMAVAILIPALIIFSFISQYGSFYILTSDLSLKASLEQGYKLFVKNIWPSIIMSLLFIPINIIAGIIMIIPIIILIAIFVFIGFILYQIFSTPSIWVIGFIAGIFLLTLLLFIRSVLSVFYHSAWFLFFQEIATVKKEEIKVEEELIIESDIQPEKA